MMLNFFDFVRIVDMLVKYDLMGRLSMEIICEQDHQTPRPSGNAGN